MGIKDSSGGSDELDSINGGRLWIKGSLQNAISALEQYRDDDDASFWILDAKIKIENLLRRKAG